jgi:hypothetical protein
MPVEPIDAARSALTTNTPTVVELLGSRACAVWGDVDDERVDHLNGNPSYIPTIIPVRSNVRRSMIDRVT